METKANIFGFRFNVDPPDRVVEANILKTYRYKSLFPALCRMSKLVTGLSHRGTIDVSVQLFTNTKSKEKIMNRSDNGVVTGGLL